MTRVRQQRWNATLIPQCCAALTSLAVLSASVAAPSSGCGAAGLIGGTYTMKHGDLTRTYRVHVPSGYEANHPARLMLLFHGWGGSENEFLDDSTVIAQANARGYILVAPRGLGGDAPDHRRNSWTFRGSATGLDGDAVNPRVPRDTALTCRVKTTPNFTYPSCARVAANSCSWTQCQDNDVEFAVALVHQIEATLCVDKNNVFAMGGSNGGMFVWELGQNPASAGVFRALAPLIGLPHRAYLHPPAVSGNLPVLLITGKRDTTVPPGTWENLSFTTSSDGGSYHYASATAVTRVWARANGCPIAGDPVAFDVGRAQAQCRTYCAGDGGWPRVLDCRADMAHDYGLTWSWPLIMDFFDHHAAD